MPGNIVRFGFVVEGHGEVEAVPLLIRRICNELFGVYGVKTTQAVRITKSKLVKEGELARAIRLALINNQSRGPVLVVLDADDDCPVTLGAHLKAQALAIIQPHAVSIVIPKREFETWFLAAAHSLRGQRGLREDLLPPSDPEVIRGAKEWLTGNMAPGKTYSPSVDQAALADGMDLTEARACKSFDRLCREIERLVVPH